MAIELHHLQAQAFDVAGKAIDEISRLRAENDNEKDEVEFIEKSIAALKEQKDVLTKRIKTLLDET